MSDTEPAYEEQVARGIRAEIDMLVATARATMDAERSYWTARLQFTRAQAQKAAVLGGLAIAVAIAALIALIVGLLMSLATLVGPGWATLIVTLLFLGLSALLGMKAAGEAKKISFGGGER